MKSRRFSSLIALTLAIVCVGGLLAACNKNGGEVPKVKLEHVYSMESVPLPEGVQRTETFLYAADRVFFTTAEYVEDAGYTTKVYSMNTDGSDAKVIYEYAESGGQQEEGIYSSKYIIGIYADPQGNLLVAEGEYYEDSRDPDNYIYENRNNLIRFDGNGNELGAVDLASLSKEEESIYIRQILFDNSGNMIIASDSSLYYVDPETMALRFAISAEDRYFDQISLTADGSVICSMWDNKAGGQVLVSADTAAKGWGEPIPLPGNVYVQNLMPGTGSYDFFYRDEQGIQGYNKTAGTFEEVLNWVNSDINPGYISTLAIMPDGRFLCTEYNYQNQESSLGILKEIPPGEIKETMVLTYASRYMDYDVREKVIAFNKSNGDYRITIKTYQQYDSEENNWQGGIEQLNMDIIQGNVPDIINLSGLNANTYISKGLLADIYPLMDADETVSREDYLQNVLDACSKDGKLYQFMPSFSIYTLAAKSSLVGSTPGWTMEELNALLKRFPEANAFSETTREDILNISARLAMDSFINMETGTCDFNSEGFIQLLEFAKNFPETIDWQALQEQYEDNWDEYYTMYENQYREDKTLLMNVYCYDLRSIRNTIERFGEDVTFIGFPTSTKNGSSIDSYSSYAISSKCKNQQVCWDFIKQFAPNEVKIDYPYYSGQLSINKNALNQLIEFEKTPMEDRPRAEEYGVAISSKRATPTSVGGEFDQDEYYKNYPLTQKEIDQMLELINSVNQISYQNTSVMNIISEEIGPFFDGKKTAAATAEIIQQRVQLYVAENQ